LSSSHGSFFVFNMIFNGVLCRAMAAQIAFSSCSQDGNIVSTMSGSGHVFASVTEIRFHLVFLD